ncbi:MAG: glycerophosphodiester phosphodiesterase family protein [Planctomycetia bacterium]|nr:glycerophosphodiester phosphodiesterase family protein [Planctomycetia bacterium]
MKKIWMTGIVLLCGCWTAEAQLPEIASRIRTMAHRGDYYNAPDNTLPSLQMAIETGVDSCEFDVWATKDGHLVLLHDSTFEHVTCGACKRRVTEMTLEEVRALDVGIYKGEKWKGTQCPTLEEALKLFQGSGCIPVIEIKQPGTEKAIADMLKAYDMVLECAIVSFHHESIRRMWELCPGIYAYRNGGERKEMTDEEYVQWFLDSQKDCPYRVANPSAGNMNVRTIQLLKKAGFVVSTWIVDDPQTMHLYLDAGIDTMTTNRPAVFVNVMKERKAGELLKKQK